MWKLYAGIFIVLFLLPEATFFLLARIVSVRNYKHNRSIDMEEGFQRVLIKDQEKYGNRRFILSGFGGVGCEIAAAFNAMLLMGKYVPLSEVIREFERKDIQFNAGLGFLGSNPRKMPRFFRKYGVQFKRYSSFEKLKADADRADKCLMIFSTKNNYAVCGIHSIHTFAVVKEEGRYKSFNGYIDRGTEDISKAVRYKFEYGIMLKF